jgi:hypothetical protein
MHLKVFLKLKKTLKTLSCGQIYKKPQKNQKTKKPPKKKNPLGWFLKKKKPGFFQPCLLVPPAALLKSPRGTALVGPGGHQRRHQVPDVPAQLLHQGRVAVGRRGEGGHQGGQAARQAQGWMACQNTVEFPFSGSRYFHFPDPDFSIPDPGHGFARLNL